MAVAGKMKQIAFTIRKPTAVSHSCVGNFTGPDHLNVILAKSSCIEIHLATPQGLELMLDVPIYGTIRTLLLFRPPCASCDLLFLVTNTPPKYCLLQWDAISAEVTTRATGDAISASNDRPAVCPKIQTATIDPDCTLILLYLYESRENQFFKAIPLDQSGHLMEPFDVRLEDVDVLDVKFLCGFEKPSIGVLEKWTGLTQKFGIYEFDCRLRALRFLPDAWEQYRLVQVQILIPVPRPLCGFLLVDNKAIHYHNGATREVISIATKIQAYGRGDSDVFSYLLGDLNGNLHHLVLLHDKFMRYAGLKLRFLGKTSEPSTISYLKNGYVYVGSLVGDSQLIKLNLFDLDGVCVEVVERYDNLGPINDFCMVYLEGKQQVQVVTCSVEKEGLLRVFHFGIKGQASDKLQYMNKGMWSLRSSTSDLFDTFLVLSFINETQVYAMNKEAELESADITTKGFAYDVETLFCQNALHDQLVQVTASSVRLVSSLTGVLQQEWLVPSGYVSVATANATQVLVATGDRRLIYLEIGAGQFKEANTVTLEHEVSCLDINPVGENVNYSQIAAVGMWTDYSVRIYSLPDLNLRNKQQGEECIARSVLLCTFDGVSYLLCGLGDGHLLSYVLDTHTGNLSNRMKVSLGTQPIRLETFSCRSVARVFAVSDRLNIICSSNKELFHCNISMKKARHICSFNPAAFPDCLAIAKEGELTIGTIDDMLNSYILSVPLGEKPLLMCHQEQLQSFAVITHTGDKFFVRLVDDVTFGIVSSYPLLASEKGHCIVSCSFSGDEKAYYCVGTGRRENDEVYAGEELMGRILVFVVEDRKLKLICESETKGEVMSLNAFNGKLLAGIKTWIELYKWTFGEDGTRELESQWLLNGLKRVRYVKTRGDSTILVARDPNPEDSLVAYRNGEGDLPKQVFCFGDVYLRTMEILNDETYIGAVGNNLIILKGKGNGATDEERGLVEVVGQYHLGEEINRFHHGSLVVRPGYKVDQIPRVFFCTVSGGIGVVASIPNDQFLFLEKLQSNMQKVIRGVGGLSHEDWRSFSDTERTLDAGAILDGDLVESFIGLSISLKNDISQALGVSVQEITKGVEKLTMLH